MTTVKERPILFSGPMVRAILSGAKTQTRRAVKADRYRHQPQCQGPANPSSGNLVYRLDDKWGPSAWDDSDFVLDPIAVCPYGQPGDRLWVRETFDISPEPTGWEGHHWLTYVADGDRIEVDCAEFYMGRLKPGKRYPSIHMPRWASRIMLEITGVRVERLQDISIDDVIAEGIEPVKNGPHANQYWREETGAKFVDLWESINGPDSWAANPWVWVIEFKRIEGGV